MTNPTATNTTFYVRISTFSAATPTGTAIDTGNVAASTATPIQLSGQMPESLVFCVGATVSETSGVPDCTTATAGTVAFTTLFSPTYTSTATSQMAASTNAGSGFVITASGATLTSGTNTITAITGTSPVSPVLGTSQFGINLVANTTATATPAPLVVLVKVKPEKKDDVFVPMVAEVVNRPVGVVQVPSAVVQYKSCTD